MKRGQPRSAGLFSLGGMFFDPTRKLRHVSFARGDLQRNGDGFAINVQDIAIQIEE